jgi:lysophospholipid acyltransferase 5
MYILSAPIAWLLGIQESGVRLFLTVLAGYPIAFHYHKIYVKEKPDATPRERNHYILWTGILLSFLFNVFDIFHSFVTIGISYYICYMGDQFHNRKAGAIAVWTFNLIYLLIGYVFAASDSYDINWTTTQCVLCLRLMGFSTDFMDGGAILNRTLEQQQEEEKKQLKVKHPHSFGQDAPLKSLPDFEQVLGYCFFPSAFLIGPQFSFSLYRRFLSGPYNGIKQEDLRYTEQIQSNYVKRCLSTGLFYILVLQLVGTSYPTTHLLTEEYRSQGFLTRLVDFWICGKMVYVKYLGVWLLTEGKYNSK